MMEFVQT